MPKKHLHISSWLVLIVITFLTVFSTTILAPEFARAQGAGDTLKGLNETANKITAFSGQTNSNDYNSVFIATRAGQIIGLVLSFIGILFLALMIYAGIMWMTAAGNEQRITSSKDLLINASIGIVIVFSAYAITVFIGNQFLGN